MIAPPAIIFYYLQGLQLFCIFATKVAKFLDKPSVTSAVFSVSETKTNEFVLYFSRLFVTLQH